MKQNIFVQFLTLEFFSARNSRSSLYLKNMRNGLVGARGRVEAAVAAQRLPPATGCGPEPRPHGGGERRVKGPVVGPGGTGREPPSHIRVQKNVILT